MRSAGSGVAQSAAQTARSHPDRGGAVRDKGHCEAVPVNPDSLRLTWQIGDLLTASMAVRRLIDGNLTAYEWRTFSLQTAFRWHFNSAIVRQKQIGGTHGRLAASVAD